MKPPSRLWRFAQVCCSVCQLKYYVAERSRWLLFLAFPGIEALGYHVEWSGKNSDTAWDDPEAVQATLEVSAVVVVLVTKSYGRHKSESREELNQILMLKKDIVVVKLTDEVKTHTRLDSLPTTKKCLPDTPHSVLRTLVTALVHERYTKLLHKEEQHVESIYRGETEDGLKCGKGWLYMSNGHRYAGEFLNDEMHGYGELHLSNNGVYSGEFREGKFHGKGELRHANGDVYLGEFKYGEYNGTGVMKSPKMGDFDGEFKEGVFQYGVHRTPDGDEYEGQFKEKKLNGRGLLRKANGDEYDGEWEDHKFHGHGQYTSVDGDCYVGEFKHGLRHGYGQLTYATGSWYKGDFQMDQRHGKGSTYDIETQTVENGEWHKDKKID